MIAVRLLAASALALAAATGVASAQQQAPEGRVYVFHSKAAGGCPALDWHVAVGANNSLSGMIAWDDMKSMAHASGSINVANRTFQMTAKEVGGQGRSATVDGTVRPDGWFVANVKGPKIDCKGITVPWYVPATSTSG